MILYWIHVHTSNAIKKQASGNEESANIKIVLWDQKRFTSIYIQQYEFNLWKFFWKNSFFKPSHSYREHRYYFWGQIGRIKILVKFQFIIKSRCEHVGLKIVCPSCANTVLGNSRLNLKKTQNFIKWRKKIDMNILKRYVMKYSARKYFLSI